MELTLRVVALYSILTTLVVKGFIVHPPKPFGVQISKLGAAIERADPESPPRPFYPSPSDLPNTVKSGIGPVPIDCYVDAFVVISGRKYAVGSPCDYCVALCSYENEGQLVPVEEGDEVLDRLFPIAEKVIEEEFGEDLALVRTAQTLTLVGELDLDEEEDEEEGGEGVEGAEGDAAYEQDDEEEVELLLAFDFEEREYNLVRMMDPVLLVGEVKEGDKVVLLSDEESEHVLPIVEETFMKEM
ncbi:hypothetical protein TrRE_jg9028 [Triparma retinervis]|uniref:Uncharacterized protein n=1 Tax=Triparma retinervis TaxID=2557542 RepID=A0A9W7DWA7_9STRA|nr:hypothetical protein TrRE_jg9028 [Triparma retinervis]